MLKNIFLFVSIMFGSLQASEFDCKKGLGEAKIVITPKNIICENENILVEFEGEYYPVRSLEKSDMQWFATIDTQNAFCPRGHNVCGYCYQCHTPGCKYAALPPCWITK